MKWLSACLCLAVAPTLLAVDCRVRTSGGEILEGEVTIDAKLGFVITNAEIGSTSVPVAKLGSAIFNLSTRRQTNETANATPTLPDGWTNKDIGPASQSGKAHYENGNLTVFSSGARIWGPDPDQIHFAYRPFVGDGQLVARVTGSDAAMAGIMFRAALDPYSLFAMEAITPGPEGMIFRSRREPAHRELTHSQGDWLNHEEIKAPCWLKLVRNERRVRAFKSDDEGLTWQPIYDSPFEWSRNIYAGLFVMGGETNVLKKAMFSDVLIEDEVDERAKSRNTASKVQVFLNDGSALSAESVSADQTKIKIALANATNSASIYAIARLIFRPVPDRLKRELAAGRKGVLLNSGDFFEGDLRLIDKEHVQVASILFGPRNFPTEKVLAILLSDSFELPAKYVVRMQDGSVLRARSITPGSNAISADELKLGALELPLSQLAEIEQSPANHAK